MTEKFSVTQSNQRKATFASSNDEKITIDPQGGGYNTFDHGELYQLLRFVLVNVPNQASSDSSANNAVAVKTNLDNGLL